MPRSDWRRAVAAGVPGIRKAHGEDDTGGGPLPSRLELLGSPSLIPLQDAHTNLGIALHHKGNVDAGTSA